MAVRYLENAFRISKAIGQWPGLVNDYHALHKYSVESYTFWLDLWEFLGIKSSVPPKKVIGEGTMPEVPRWFPDARLNYAENLLYRADDAIACTAGGETGTVQHYTYRQLRELVRQMACAMRRHGMRKGDRVAGVLNNTITAVVIALATASIGAIYSSTATDMGTQGILDRYRQIKPRFVFAETEISYGGVVVNLVPKMTEVFQDLKNYGLQHAIALPSSLTGKEIQIPNSSVLSKFLAMDDGRELIFEQLPFSHPLFILFSSGTSGPPKCMVHSAGGVLIQNMKEMKIHFGMNQGDTIFAFTTTGWMLWNAMLANLANGVRLVLYSGSPFYPDIPTFLKFVSDQGVSCWGTSPRFLAEIKNRGINPLEIGPFKSLHTVSAAGSVLTSPMFIWTQKAFGAHIRVNSSCGGTDICTTFVSGMPSLPVYAGETQCKSLGMDIRALDPQGKNLEDAGVAGELVCARPHPSMPLYFWGDESNKKYRAAYFDMYPGIWRQGDFIVFNPLTKGVKILGRSDGVLNPSGVRFGAAEIYSVLEGFSTTISDMVCVGQRRPQDEDERVLLFVKMQNGHVLDETLVGRIKNAVRTGLSARHVPAYVFAVEDIPYTSNGKRIEIAVKQIVSGVDTKPSGTVVNPESLKLYYKYRELEPNLPRRAKM
ncbi:AMP-binding domain-containing protein [Mycena sanguinolenta]|uniref:AMP-binding domain-containing protein n=1 Tax=Mycena sanguinolenta TaxID=230812 RepID=A0A8H6ZFH6_9AGAR|nr:AMP-binding domain-containing protein [Mycena sanguinolenta]